MFPLVKEIDAEIPSDVVAQVFPCASVDVDLPLQEEVESILLDSLLHLPK